MAIDLRRTLLHYAQGMLMGGADIIPGVSGGTMALIVGVYERLVDSISHVFTGAIAFVRGRRAEAAGHFRSVHWQLVIPLGLGIVTALVIGARIIPYVLATYPVQSRALFFGLIAGSLAIPWLRIGRKNATMVLVAVTSALAAFFLVGLPPSTIHDPGLLRVFLCAAVAICAMILPGVSGAFFLYVLGIYEATLVALNERNIVYVLVFIAGAGIGIGLFSKVLDYLLEHHHDLTMAALVGLMAGSLRALWPWQSPDRTLLLPTAADPVVPVILLGVAGFAFVSLLTWLGARSLRPGPAHG